MTSKEIRLVVLSGSLLGLISSVTFAAPAVSPPPAPSAPPAADAATARKDEARAALRRGRELGSKGDWAAAVTALRTAVAMDPSSAPAQSELGWAALQAGDLTLAEQAANEALTRATDDRTRAGAAYNLGRVLEARSDKPGAVAAYRRALSFRRTSVTMARLAKLDPGAAAALGPVQFYEMPDAGKAAKPVCDTTPPVPAKEPYDTFECEVVPLPAVRLAPPWLAAQAQVRHWSTNSSSERVDTLMLFLRTAKGWASWELEYRSTASPRESVELKTLSITTVPVTGRSPLLLVRTRNDYSAAWRHGDSEHCLDENIYLFALSASGSPLSSTAIPVVDVEEGTPHNGRLTARLLPDGSLEVQKEKGKLSEDQAGYVGKHRLVIP